MKQLRPIKPSNNVRNPKQFIVFLLCLCLVLSAMIPMGSPNAQAASYAENPSAGQLLRVAPQVQSWALSLKVTPSAGNSTMNIYAAVMKESTYTSKFGGSPTSFNDQNYFNTITLGLTGEDGTKYRYGTVALSDGISEAKTITIPKLTTFTVDESSASYYENYVYVLFESKTGVTGGAGSYVVGSFDVDSNGNLKTDSYMVRYMQNNGANGGTGSKMGGMPTPIWSIVPYSPGTTTLTNTVPTRTGYTFLGWDEKADKQPVTNGPAATKPDGGAKDSVTAKHTSGKVVGLNDLGSPAKFSIKSLYAQWEPVDVKIGPQAAALSELRVNVPFTYQAIITGAAATTKTVSISEVKWYNSSGALVTGSSVTALPKGLQGLTNAGKLSGTPTEYTAPGKEISFQMTVTDSVNHTWNAMTVTLPAIQKGLQAVPDPDWNTGIQGRTADNTSGDGIQSGEVFGFYSEGKGATDYAIMKPEKIYEYRPKGEGAYRPLPMPESVKPSAELLTSVNAITVSGIDVWPSEYGEIDYEKATYIHSQKDGTQATRWNPIVRGVSEGAILQVRFRVDDNYDASLPIEVAASGAGGTSTSTPPGPSEDSGYSLIFNLMGGAVSDTTSGEAVSTDPFQTMTGLSEGEIVTLPAIAPVKTGTSFEGWFDGTNTYTTGQAITMPAASVGLAAKWAGVADPSDFATLVFYDWDDTLLGSAIISKTAKKEEVEASLNAFNKTQYHLAEGAELPPDFTKVESSVDTYADNADRPLTYKLGYNFSGWVQVDGGEGTESLADAFTAYEAMDAFTAGDWDYSQVPAAGWGNITLKAGYVENDTCNFAGDGVSAAMKAYYSIGDLIYNRYGAASVILSNGEVTSESGNYSIKMTVKRQNAGNYGVTRLYKPVVRVSYKMNINGQMMNMYNFSVMSGADEQTVEVIAPRNAADFTLTVVDAGQRLANGNIVASYTLADAVSSNQEVKKSAYLSIATLNYFNDKARAHNESLPSAIDGDWSSNVSNPDFFDLGLYDSKIDQYYYQYGKPGDLATTNAAQLRNIAKNKITLYMLGKGNRSLTVEEIKEAIGMETGAADNSKVPAAINTNIKIAYGNVKKAYASNGERELTAEQIAYAINNSGALLP